MKDGAAACDGRQNWRDASCTLLAAQCAQRLPDLAIDARSILRRRVNQLYPPPAVGVEFAVTEQIASLQNCLKGIAEVVCKRPQLQDVFIVLGRLNRLYSLGARCRFRRLSAGRLHTFDALARSLTPLACTVE